MWHMLVGVLAKAAVMFTGLADTQRQLRMTATIVVLDVATLPQHLERQCPVQPPWVQPTLASAVAPTGKAKAAFTLPAFSLFYWRLLAAVEGVHMLPDLLCLWRHVAALWHRYMVGLNRLNSVIDEPAPAEAAAVPDYAVQEHGVVLQVILDQELLQLARARNQRLREKNGVLLNAVG